MSSWAYYNEWDPYSAEWIRNLIKAGHVAPGEVDERSIEDVRPDDLKGFVQVHMFAGIAVWSYALRRAGWPDDRSVWTGSCPCQPFSAAGKGAGFSDERHLWPAFYHLIAERRPAEVLGEQVASKDADPWIDLVQADLEALGYAFGAVPFPSAGVGAPHIRDRLYWVANADHQRRDRQHALLRPEKAGRLPRPLPEVAGRGTADGMDHAYHARLERLGRGHQVASGWVGEVRPAAEAGEFGGLADHDGLGRNALPGARLHNVEHHLEPCSRADEASAAGPTNGHWRAADWLLCRDGRWRPVEPGAFPLVDGLAAGMGALSPGLRRMAEVAGLDAASLKRAKAYRPGALRGFGNAINAESARVFIECVMECRP